MTRLMATYALFLIMGAQYAVAVSGWDRSKTALFSSAAAGCLMIVAIFLSASPNPARKTRGNLLGVVFPLLFGLTFIWRYFVNRAKPTAEEWLAQNPGVAVAPTRLVESTLQNWLFPTFIAASFATCVGLVWLKSRSTT